MFKQDKLSSITERQGLIAQVSRVSATKLNHYHLIGNALISTTLLDHCHSQHIYLSSYHSGQQHPKTDTILVTSIPELTPFWSTAFQNWYHSDHQYPRSDTIIIISIPDLTPFWSSVSQNWHHSGQQHSKTDTILIISIPDLTPFWSYSIPDLTPFWSSVIPELIPFWSTIP